MFKWTINLFHVLKKSNTELVKNIYYLRIPFERYKIENFLRHLNASAAKDHVRLSKYYSSSGLFNTEILFTIRTLSKNILK